MSCIATRWSRLLYIYLIWIRLHDRPVYFLLTRTTTNTTFVTGSRGTMAGSCTRYVRHTSVGRNRMAAKMVVLYFDDQVDALRFTLSASSVMAGEGHRTAELSQALRQASRLLVEETVHVVEAPIERVKNKFAAAAS